jgi:hypothetical protein
MVVSGLIGGECRVEIAGCFSCPAAFDPVPGLGDRRFRRFAEKRFGAREFERVEQGGLGMLGAGRLTGKVGAAFCDQ